MRWLFSEAALPFGWATATPGDELPDAENRSPAAHGQIAAVG